MFVSDFGIGSWIAELAPLPTLRSGAATAVLGSAIAVIGGEVAASVTRRTRRTTRRRNSWRTLAPMPSGRHGIQAAKDDNGVVYIAGGGLKPGGAGPTDIQESFMLAPPASSRSDCRVRLQSEMPLTGDNVCGTDGAG